MVIWIVLCSVVLWCGDDDSSKGIIGIILGKYKRYKKCRIDKIKYDYDYIIMIVW